MRQTIIPITSAIIWLAVTAMSCTSEKDSFNFRRPSSAPSADATGTQDNHGFDNPNKDPLAEIPDTDKTHPMVVVPGGDDDKLNASIEPPISKLEWDGNDIVDDHEFQIVPKE